MLGDVKVKARGEGPRAVQRIAVWQIDWMPVFGDILVYRGLVMVGSSERETWPLRDVPCQLVWQADSLIWGADLGARIR